MIALLSGRCTQLLFAFGSPAQHLLLYRCSVRFAAPLLSGWLCLTSQGATPRLGCASLCPKVLLAQGPRSPAPSKVPPSPPGPAPQARGQPHIPGPAKPGARPASQVNPGPAPQARGQPHIPGPAKPGARPGVAASVCVCVCVWCPRAFTSAHAVSLCVC